MDIHRGEMCVNKNFWGQRFFIQKQFPGSYKVYASGSTARKRLILIQNQHLSTEKWRRKQLLLFFIYIF